MLGKLLVLALATGVAYLGARRLINDPGLIEEPPEPAREPAHELRERLLDLDTLVRDVLADVASERRRAEEELRDEYLSRVGRREDDAPPDFPTEAWGTAPERN